MHRDCVDDDTQRAEIVAATAPEAGLTMKLRTILVVALLLSGFAGCSHNELFSGLDYCYWADWTNHHSYLSCCNDCGQCETCRPGAVQ
jgi:hypothetical protein